MSDNIIQQVTLDRSNRKKDRSVSITFITDLEMSSTEFAKIDELNNASGILYFKTTGDLTQAELDAIDNMDIEVNGKSKSARLRNVLYRLHEQQDKDETFENFYSRVMEALIDKYKLMLD